MNRTQVKLVQESFARVAPISEAASVIFYDRLFDVAPSVKALFPAASAPAKRHVGYGARPEHYAVVGGALLWTLEKGLGEVRTNELADAWGAAYGTLSGYMISEAYGRAQAAE
jgi:hemoglobin-like flavoprotein